MKIISEREAEIEGESKGGRGRRERERERELDVDTQTLPVCYDRTYQPLGSENMLKNVSLGTVLVTVLL